MMHRSEARRVSQPSSGRLEGGRRSEGRKGYPGRILVVVVVCSDAGLVRTACMGACVEWTDG